MAEENHLWRIQLYVPAEQVVAVELLLDRFEIDSFEVQDRDTQKFGVVPGCADEVCVIAYGAGARLKNVRASFEATHPEARSNLAPFEQKDWLDTWKEYIPATVVANRVVVRPPFLESPRADLPEIVIDPGMAFGTGGHETTRLVLELAIQHLETPPESLLERSPIADVGCGTAVIGACLARLGWGPIHGCDIDPVAIEVAQEVLSYNSVTEDVILVQGSVDDLVGPYPILIANVLSKHLLNLSAAIYAKTEPGATIILSGILNEDLEPFLNQFLVDCPAVVQASAVRNEWVGVRLERA